MNKNEYDEESVFYCADCLSLMIKTIDGMDYCCKCGSTDIREAKDIFEWKRVCSERYEKKQ